MDLADGLYESLLTEGLDADLMAARAAELEARLGDVDAADQPQVLARHVYQNVLLSLEGTKDTQQRIALVNALLGHLNDARASVLAGPKQLLELRYPPAPGRITRASIRPTAPLSETDLFTNAPGEPNLGAELRAEIETADRVDLICAFVQWHGLRVVADQLQRLRDRGASLRVITTTYIGATERRALDRLVEELGATVRVQYDAQRTRLHAKAWLFGRYTGFDTAYVGSSNLSKAALLDGVEWNVRLSRVATPAVLAKFQATFDTYWNEPSYENYDPQRDRDRLDDALAEAGGSSSSRSTIALTGFEVRPYPHQEEILERIATERAVHDRHRNLVVAATGTGKTVVAALDYRRLCERSDRPRLLFVAHRREILDQALRTYREVLTDANFGERYVDGARPERWQHVFASVQSLNSYGIANIPPDAYDVVVIDEFHHVEAASYRRILDRLEPTELLGLTATPERGDGIDVRTFFGNRVAAELRLWDALEAELLSPFHYFGIADGVDLSGVEWRRGRYDDTTLSAIYTGNDARAALVLRQAQDKIGDLGSMRALGFCVSVAHARYMARFFETHGVPARAVVGESSPRERGAALDDLRRRRINVIFTADLYNEGVDLPQIDTVFFLRPTESATIFLQQLGRGLRRVPGKAVLTALDFVGQNRTEFRFDRRYRALTGATRKGLERQVEKGFPFLPSGCQIVLDQQTQRNVLDNLRRQVSQSWPTLVSEARSSGDLPLAEFLDESGIDLADILRGDRSWTRLRRELGVETRPIGAREAELLKRTRAFAHVDDPERARAYDHLLGDDAPRYADLDASMQAYARMLFFSLWPGGGGFADYAAGLEALRAEPVARDELRAISAIALDTAAHVTTPLGGPLRPVPLRVHARYQREEILAALGHASLNRLPRNFREGVAWLPDLNTDAFLVTLRKSEADYSPTTMYRDYAISPELFHWQSQVGTSIASPTGQRYLNQRDAGTHVLLFTRDTRADDLGTSAYLCLGTVQYVRHQGERPISITWKLDTPMPTDVFVEARRAAG